MDTSSRPASPIFLFLTFFKSHFLQRHLRLRLEKSVSPHLNSALKINKNHFGKITMEIERHARLSIVKKEKFEDQDKENFKPS